MQMRIGSSLDDQVAIEGVKLGDQFNSQVIDALIQISLQIGQEGFEGHPIGTIIVIGDHNAVLEKSRQLTINPFQGLSEAERNVLDPQASARRSRTSRCSTAPSSFARTAWCSPPAATCRRPTRDVKIPLGLGARHAAAASITASANVHRAGGEPDLGRGAAVQGRQHRARAAPDGSTHLTLEQVTWRMLKFEVPNTSPSWTTPRSASRRCSAYWGRKYGVKSSWTGEKATMSGKAMGVAIDGNARGAGRQGLRRGGRPRHAAARAGEEVPHAEVRPSTSTRTRRWTTSSAARTSRPRGARRPLLRPARAPRPPPAALRLPRRRTPTAGRRPRAL